MSNCKRFIGKVVIVTGSTKGIGFEVAKRFLDEGAKVMICSRKIANVENALKLLSDKYGEFVAGIPCHVAKKEDRERLFSATIEKFGGLDVLVNNAAVNPFVGIIVDTSEEIWQKIFDVNVTAPFMLLKESVPLLRERGGGSIVFISTINSYSPTGLVGAYSSSKTAVLGLCKTAARELATENIRVNSVAPGLIETDFSREYFQQYLDYYYKSDKDFAAKYKLIPMNRLGHPSDVAGSVAFLASEDASYITGESIVVAGGMLSRL